MSKPSDGNAALNSSDSARDRTPAPTIGHNNPPDSIRAPPERLAYGVDDLCEVAGVGRSFVYKEIAAGRLKSIKRGKRRLFTAEAVKAWLAA